MTLRRDDIPEAVSELLGGRPARWSETAVADYDGRERTLELFEADASEQRALLRTLRPLRAELLAGAGGSLVVIFHTRAESRRLYAEYLDTWRAAQLEEQRRVEGNARLAALVATWIGEPADDEPALGLEDIEPIDLGEAA